MKRAPNQRCAFTHPPKQFHQTSFLLALKEKWKVWLELPWRPFLPLIRRIELEWIVFKELVGANIQSKEKSKVLLPFIKRWKRNQLFLLMKWAAIQNFQFCWRQRSTNNFTNSIKENKFISFLYWLVVLFASLVGANNEAKEMKKS